MKKFNENKAAFMNVNKKLENRPEYKKMLNNLLGIGNRDNAIFSSSKINNMDLLSLLSPSDYKKIFKSETFKVEITNTNDDIAIKSLISSKTIDEFIWFADNNAIYISITDRKLLEDNFIDNKVGIINKLKKQKNKFIAKWKKIKNKYLDMQSQTNSWPLYIGSMFISVRTTSSTLYAPLIMKKVEIEITHSNKVYLKSIDPSVDINEKLLFLLQKEYKFSLSALDAEEKYSINDVAEKYSNDLNKIIDSNFSFQAKFQFMTKATVKNLELKYEAGVVLTFVSPSGGELRNKLIDILDTQKIEDLLDIDPLKNINKEVDDYLKNQKHIFRITKTDLSQEKAIIGSLIDSSIIWGPPGTGKSQTISNIIANLLEQDKNVIITSEKKAALDVIKERMGLLAKYMFFGLVDKKYVNKDEFYKPFQELLKMVVSSTQLIHNDGSPSITNNQLEYLEQASALADEDLSAVSRLSSLNNNNHKCVKKMFDNNLILRESLFVQKITNGESYLEAITSMNIKKTGFFFRRYPKDVRVMDYLLNKNKIEKTYVKSFMDIKNHENIFQSNEIIETEKKYILQSNDNVDHMAYLDNLLASRFREKINRIKQMPKYEKKIITFLKNVNSGFRVPYKFANIYKDIIDELFSVFVSTPDTLAGIINMDAQYDFAIFDEASQLHLEKAIPFISIADKSIISGDNQQMRPTNYFISRDNSDVEDDSEVNVDSLLEYAYRKGLGDSREYMLSKNYRSMNSELMIFSSKEFYNSELDTVDAHGFDIESIIVFDVKGKWEGRVNETEAKATLECALNNLKTFKSIIILTLNSTQKQHIDALIYEDPNFKNIIDALENDQIKLRNLENIQGDEADLVIISVAYDKTARLSATYVAKSTGRNALNVAISRAKSKMIVFKSISSFEVTGSNKNASINTFKSWLEYLELSSKERKGNYLSVDSHKESETFDSSFEEDVYDYIKENLKTSKKVYIMTQYSVGSYKIDISIMNNKTHKFMLGIEVDGYKYHSGFEKMVKDIERQKFLEAKNYPIYRITELNWKMNKKEEIKKIESLLKKIK
ncbi:AAA domain-containing protein [Candidatus Mycoplasma mahonii]|uniref:AAA domain-containing protein n=1 Tax=Candidatus Mycoplasma mahonii TaxID=3004105 RepID=UPI0026F08ABE|nr:AAA domain-containing protein [Candidatus Mycoplasma mahonii]WKX02577.1 AAA domain-containing protein [Candidatus Mycoplasma mahonii]